MKSCYVVWGRLMNAGTGHTRFTADRILHLIILVAGLSIFLISQWTFRDTIEDDAYISFRYARNWLEGHGLVYNPGERVEGYTNLLWVLILAGLNAIGVDFESAAMILGVVIGSLLLLLIAIQNPIARSAYSDDISSVHQFPQTGALVALMLGLNPAFQAEAAMGLETLLFTFLVTMGVWSAARDFVSHDCSIRTVLWLAPTAWTRPEGIWIGALVLLIQCLQLIRTQRLSLKRLRGTMLFVIAVTAIEVFRYLYYGDWFPNTFAAKTGNGLNQLIRGWGYMRHFLSQFTYPAAAVVLVVPFMSGPFRRFTRIPAIWLMLYFVYIVAVGGDYKPTHRFFIAALPTLYLFLVLFIRDFSLRMSRFAPASMSRSVPNLITVALAGLYLAVSVPLHRETQEFMQACKAKIRIDRACSDWLIRNASPTETLATEVAGRIPFYTGMVTYDMSGLNDRHIARNAIPFDGMLPAGHDRTDAPYIVARRPDYILFHSILVTGEPDPDLRGRQINYFESELWKVKAFHDQYQLMSVRLNDQAYFNFFRRIDLERGTP